MSNNYKHLKLAIHENFATIYLDSSPDNSLDFPLMDELIHIHRTLDDNEKIKAVLLTSLKPGFFCNGLNIDLLLEADRNQRINIFSKFYDACAAIYSYKKAHISLINGHAMAGGAMLASLSDFRFMSNGRYRIAFSEVRLGITIPSLFIEILKNTISSQNLRVALLQPRAFKPPEACEIGFIHEVFPESEASVKTQRFISLLLQTSIHSYSSIKTNLRGDIQQKFQSQKKDVIAELTPFFNDNFTEGLLALKEKRRPKFL